MQSTEKRAFSLTDEELKNFYERGYHGPFKVYEPEEMEAVWKRQRLQMLDRSKAIYQDATTKEGPSNNIANYDRHLDMDFLADHISLPQIVDRVISVLGPDVLCWRTEFFPKYPGDEGTDWHQADTFANASGHPQILWPDEVKEFGGTITVWTAFTEASEENGCLQFIPGTHQQMNYDESRGMHYDPATFNSEVKDGKLRGFYGYDYRTLQIDPDWKPDESKAVSMVMKPGEAILFWSTLMHASFPNSTKDRMRLGMASRYVPPSVRVYPDTEELDEFGGKVSIEKYGAVLVSGEDRFGHNRIATETTRGHRFTRR